jgi:hypothetical protein
VDLDSIESRVSIREALHRGDVESAIGLVNDLDPEASVRFIFPHTQDYTFMHHAQALSGQCGYSLHQTSVFNMTFLLPSGFLFHLANYDLQILDTNPSLYFHLQQQRLIEFIRLGRIDDALQFAQDELAPRGEESPQFLSELENTMALLAFEASSSMPGGMADLLSPAQRIKTAGEVNAAILGHFNQGREAKLIALLKLLCWGEAVLEEHADFPRVCLIICMKLPIKSL